MQLCQTFGRAVLQDYWTNKDQYNLLLHKQRHKLSSLLSVHHLYGIISRGFMHKRGVLPRKPFPSKWLSLQFLGLGVDSLGDDRTLVLGVCVGLRVSLLGVSSALDIPWGSNSLLSESMKVYCKRVCVFVQTCMYTREWSCCVKWESFNTNRYITIPGILYSLHTN